MSEAVAVYREFVPGPELRDFVDAFFTFTTPGGGAAGRRMLREVVFRHNEPFCSPLFADGHVSIVFGFDKSCGKDGSWHPATPCASVIGAMSAVGPAASGERSAMAGAYLRPGQTRRLLGCPARELTDRIAALDDLWGAAGREALQRLGESSVDSERVGELESMFARRVSAARETCFHGALDVGALDVPGLALWARSRRGRVSVQGMADACGVARQSLTRAFRESVGVGPKLYCRLARFQAGLGYSDAGRPADWAEAALEMGYTDQSHMIAEFRQFSSLTPEALRSGRWFHPFIERARRP
jgi:AraC-like DNA-binding protein